MKRNIFFGIFMIVILLQASCDGGTNCKEIEVKISELSDLRNRLDLKKNEVINLQGTYDKGIQALKQEIQQEMSSRNIDSYAESKRVPRISYDLSLIQRKRAYIKKLVEIEGRLDHGSLELEFLQRQAEDDLPLCLVTDKDDVKDLIDDINRVIEKYLPDANQLVIDIDEASMQTPEQIWQEIFAE